MAPNTKEHSNRSGVMVYAFWELNMKILEVLALTLLCMWTFEEVDKRQQPVQSWLGSHANKRAL